MAFLLHSPLPATVFPMKSTLTFLAEVFGTTSSSSKDVDPKENMPVHQCMFLSSKEQCSHMNELESTMLHIKKWQGVAADEPESQHENMTCYAASRTELFDKSEVPVPTIRKKSDIPHQVTLPFSTGLPKPNCQRPATTQTADIRCSATNPIFCPQIHKPNPGVTPFLGNPKSPTFMAYFSISFGFFLSFLKTSTSILKWVYVNFFRSSKNLKKYGSWALMLFFICVGAVVRCNKDGINQEILVLRAISKRMCKGRVELPEAAVEFWRFNFCLKIRKGVNLRMLGKQSEEEEEEEEEIFMRVFESMVRLIAGKIRAKACPCIDDSDSSQHLGSTISPFEKKSEWRWKLQCRLPLGHLQVLFPLAYDPRSHLHCSLCPSVHHPLLKLLLDQPHCLQQLSFSVYDSPTWYLIRQQSALHAIVDIKKGPVAEPGELSKPHEPALLLLLSDVENPMLRYPGWHVRNVGIDTRNEQVWSQQVDLRLAAFYGKLVVRHSRERDCVTDVFLQYLRAISVVLWSEDRALEVLDDREKVFQMHPV
ncbi:hypothetical protein OSB04_007483 [Centaurea solstitialis]|uniref:Uncharacterized protein n=1 Tax=Centaurea solstitialis TaxID=347529 RepID=A0AA38TSJ0_9ASTR|nr:hypothetical protein OSB04_007483 [Centaurea solstitialis]